MRPPSSVRSVVARFDDRVDTAFDRLRGNPVADKIFYGASELGDFGLIWILLGGVRGLRSERDWHAAMRLAGGVAVESFLVNAVIKSVFRRTRPPWEVDRPLRVRRPRTSSFPSGHATSAVTSAVLLSEDDVLWPLYWVVASVVATSRIYVKIHHASDVAAGMVVGLGLGLVGRRLIPLPPAPEVIPSHTGF